MLHLAISGAGKKLLAEKQFRRRHRRRLAPFSNINVSIPGIDGEKQTLLAGATARCGARSANFLPPNL